MALVTEDGTGMDDANGYIDVAFADSYHADRGNAAWAGSSTVKEQAIIKATDYIDTRWGALFRGAPLEIDQALAFPREELYDRQGNLVEGIPAKLKKAAAEYALRALAGELMPDPTTSETGQTIRSKKEKIGPIEESTSYMEGSTVSSIKPYPAADRLLTEYIGSSSRSFRA